MCGIVGCWNRSNKVDINNLKVMSDCLVHRGPDAEGFFVSENKSYGLGHRRLSIIDVSNFSNQPLKSKCGRYYIVFNGEIYNYLELKSRFSITTQTSSDTEVLLELYKKIGPGFVNELNGMFAFVIYDIYEDKLFIARDRVGVKPIYYYLNEEVFYFASELKSIVALVKDKLSISTAAIINYLHLGYIPEPYSIYNEIGKFPSGTYGDFKNGSLSFSNYWEPSKVVSDIKLSNKEEASNRLKDLLYSSVGYRMISDVPLGTFLSGGIDSSIVTAIAQDLSSQPINTFSIGFEDSKYNESGFARNVSNYLKTNHHEFLLKEEDAIENLLEVMDNFDEPFSDSSALPTYLVSKLASKNIKVVLSGDGGDELFLGYGSYTWANRVHKIRKLHLSKFIKHILEQGTVNLKRASNYFESVPDGLLPHHIFSQEQNLFSLNEISILLKNQQIAPGNFISKIQIPKAIKNPQERQAFFDLKFYLKDDLMVKVDRASMLASIEAREPLLDYRLIEFSLNLDKSLKTKGGTTKYLLKEVLFNRIPKSYFDRPKWGFSIPLVKWMKSDLQFIIDDNLSMEAVERTGVLNYKEIEILKDGFRKGEYYLYNRLWALAILNRWLLKFK